MIHQHVAELTLFIRSHILYSENQAINSRKKRDYE